MRFNKEKALTAINETELVRFLGFATIAAGLPFLIHQQWITGPIVNAILILVLFLSGLRFALILAFVPSLMALASGLLPAILAPVIPFIMISNIIYIYILDRFYQRIKNEKKGYWVGLFFASSFKFLFLQLSFIFISNILIKEPVVLKVAQMLSWSQLFSAVTGGMIAWVILKKIKRI
jgi:hypothetical protein